MHFSRHLLSPKSASVKKLIFESFHRLFTGVRLSANSSATFTSDEQTLFKNTMIELIETESRIEEFVVSLKWIFVVFNIVQLDDNQRNKIMKGLESRIQKQHSLVEIGFAIAEVLIELFSEQTDFGIEVSVDERNEDWMTQVRLFAWLKRLELKIKIDEELSDDVAHKFIKLIKLPQSHPCSKFFIKWYTHRYLPPSHAPLFKTPSLFLTFLSSSCSASLSKAQESVVSSLLSLLPSLSLDSDFPRGSYSQLASLQAFRDVHIHEPLFRELLQSTGDHHSANEVLFRAAWAEQANMEIVLKMLGSSQQRELPRVRDLAKIAAWKMQNKAFLKVKEWLREWAEEHRNAEDGRRREIEYNVGKMFSDKLETTDFVPNIHPLAQQRLFSTFKSALPHPPLPILLEVLSKLDPSCYKKSATEYLSLVCSILTLDPNTAQERNFVP